jgi:hypothetical protein
MLFWLFIEKRMQKPADGAPVGWLWAGQTGKSVVFKARLNRVKNKRQGMLNR